MVHPAVRSHCYVDCCSLLKPCKHVRHSDGVLSSTAVTGSENLRQMCFQYTLKVLKVLIHPSDRLLRFDGLDHDKNPKQPLSALSVVLRESLCYRHSQLAQRREEVLPFNELLRHPYSVFWLVCLWTT